TFITKTHGQDPYCSDTARVFTIAERMPEFPGGAMELHRYLAKAVSAPQHVIGRTNIAFTVQRDGSICDIVINPSDDTNWVTRTKTLMVSLPKWRPGYQRGKPVNVRFHIPLIICLR
ncbi:MAG: hypothetical protein WAT74_08295, partial [Flavobacteriales bacterium]